MSMNRVFYISVTLFCFLLISCVQEPQDNQEKIVQAVSKLGENLYSAEPSEAALEKYAEAKKKFEQEPDNSDALIWYARRAAYLGSYREAIEIYSDGIKKHPEDARLYRHRGHRYISVRKFDKAIEDFEKAASLIEGKEDIIEPDGMPNAQNIPEGFLIAPDRNPI